MLFCLFGGFVCVLADISQWVAARYPEFGEEECSLLSDACALAISAGCATPHELQENPSFPQLLAQLTASLRGGDDGGRR
jgi:hypothetical protein